MPAIEADIDKLVEYMHNPPFYITILHPGCGSCKKLYSTLKHSPNKNNVYYAWANSDSMPNIPFISKEGDSTDKFFELHTFPHTFYFASDPKLRSPPWTYLQHTKP